MKTFSKDIISFLVTVRNSILILLLTVFFSTNSIASDSSLYSLESGLSNLVYNLSQSLVTVKSTQIDNSPARGQLPVTQIVSSGLIIDSSGHIVVAAQSVMGSSKIDIRFENMRLQAKILSIDYQDMIALLKVEKPIGIPVKFSSKQSCAGQMVVAMGNAYGLRVSPSIGFCAGIREDGMMQYSMPLPSGTLGGGIFDLTGNLVAIVTDGVGSNNQVAMAVPSFKVQQAITYLKANGNRYAGFIGITTVQTMINPPINLDADQILASSNNFPQTFIESALRITSVLPGSPAEQAGLKKGDLIYAIGNRFIKTVKELSSLVRQLEPDMTVNIEIIRMNNSFSMPLKVGRRQVAVNSNAFSNHRLSPPKDQKVIDSLTAVINNFRKEINNLERRLQSVD